MKLILISYTYSPPYFGGGLNRMIRHLKSMQMNGHHIAVLTSGVPGYPANEADESIQIYRSPSVSISRLGRGLRRLFFPLWAAGQLLRHRPDIIHIESLGAFSSFLEYVDTSILTFLAKKIGAPTIKQHTLADSEEEMFSVDGLKYRLRLAAWKKYSAIVSVSPALHQAVQPHIPDNSYCIMNGVDTEVFLPLSEPVRNEYRRSKKLDQENVVFTFVGSIGYRKGFDLLAKAFAELSQDHPRWRLWVIGPSSKIENQNINEDEATQLISILQSCDDQVTYWGRVDNFQQMVTLLSSSDIFVFPTRREGFPNAPLEAMACGLPVILSRIQGVTDLLIEEGNSGIFFDIGDLKGLVNKMEDLGSDPMKRLKLGAAARQRAIYNYNWESYLANWESLYRHLVDKYSNRISPDRN